MNAAAKLRGCLRVSLTTNLVTALSFTFFALDAPAQVQIDGRELDAGGRSLDAEEVQAGLEARIDASGAPAFAAAAYAWSRIWL